MEIASKSDSLNTQPESMNDPIKNTYENQPEDIIAVPVTSIDSPQNASDKASSSNGKKPETRSFQKKWLTSCPWLSDNSVDKTTTGNLCFQFKKSNFANYWIVHQL